MSALDARGTRGAIAPTRPESAISRRAQNAARSAGALAAWCSNSLGLWPQPERKKMPQGLDSIVRGINEGLRDHFCPTMQVGATVQHPDGYHVKVLSGCFLDPVYGRVSNWWTWQRINDDGSLGDKESGYGW